MSYQTVKSVKKAMTVLELLTDRSIENRPLTLDDVVKHSGFSPGCACNLLRTLEECGYVHRTGHGKYIEGERCCKLFNSGGMLRRLTVRAERPLWELSAELGESLLLAAVVNGKRVELLRFQAADDALIDPQWGANELFYHMRTTRVFLAFLPEQQLQRIVKQNGVPTAAEWPECGGSFEKMRGILRDIRFAGGVNDISGTYAALALPIFTADMLICATLGCYMPRDRASGHRAEQLFSQLGKLAKELSENDY